MAGGAFRAAVLAMAIGAGAAIGAAAQEKGPFGGFKHNTDQPIEIVSDSLEVRQAESIAIFEGTVEAAQDTLRLTADKVTVHYDQESSDSETGAIKKLVAEGNVFLSNGSETAQGAFGEYDVENGTVFMRDNVVLTQGGNALKGQRLVIDMNTGVGRIEGRVTSIFAPSSKKKN